MHEAETRAIPDLSHLPLADETWEAVCVRNADLLGPRPIKGWALIVMESSFRQIEALEPLDVDDTDTVADTIIASFLAPENGEPRQPLHLRVPDPDLAHALQQRLHGGPTTVEVAPVADAVKRLTEALTLISHAAEEILLFPTASAPSYFRAAATLYNAKPWTVLDDDHKLRLHFVASGEVYFAAIVDDESSPAGISVFPSEEDFDRAFPLFEDDEEERPMANSRSILYVTESEVHERWREQRRHNRWVIAGPDAFPMPGIVGADGHFDAATDDDLWILAQSAAAIAGFAARNRKRLAHREACSSRIDVTGPAGKTVVEVSYTPIVDEIARALEAVLARAIALPEAKPLLQRLRWTFYRGPAPVYVANAEDDVDAAARFLTWCVFASEHFALPLADQIRTIARDIHIDEADVEALLTPRISFFDVVEIKAATLLVRDRVSNDLLTVRRRADDPDISVGDMIAGPLHDTGRGDYVMSLGTIGLPEDAARKAPRLKEEDRRTLGPAMEVYFGAGADWIDEMPRKDIRDLYEELRGALHATGDTIPNFPTLQKTIATAESPTGVLRELLEAANPWGEGETQAIAALFKRIWNMTPRPELGGRSPEQMR